MAICTFWETRTRSYHSSRISYLEGCSRCYVASVNRADCSRFRWGRLSSTARTKFFHFLPQSTVPRHIVIFLRFFFPCTWRKERRVIPLRLHPGIIDKAALNIEFDSTIRHYMKCRLLKLFFASQHCSSDYQHCYIWITHQPRLHSKSQHKNKMRKQETEWPLETLLYRIC